VRVLGIDPGTLVTGWGLLDGPARHPRLVDCGVIRLPSRDSLAARLARLHVELDEIVRRLEPTTAAVESPFHGKSSRAALQLAHARGVILSVLAGAEVEVVEYTPATVKQQVAGNGRADKQQVQRMLAHLLGRELSGQPADLTDALAVGLCHLGQADFQRALERSTGAASPAAPDSRPTLRRTRSGRGLGTK